MCVCGAFLCSLAAQADAVADDDPLTESLGAAYAAGENAGPATESLFAIIDDQVANDARTDLLSKTLRYFAPDLFWIVHYGVVRRAGVPSAEQRDAIQRAVLADPSVRSVMPDLSDVEFSAAALGCLRDMHAQMRPWAQKVFLWFTLKFVKLIYDFGVHVSVADVQRLSEAARSNRPLLLLPTHRSVVDYTIVWFLCVVCDLPLPHVVAETRHLTRFPFLRPVLRYLGGICPDHAKLADSTFYRAVLASYTRELLRAGFSIQCFIEGGRSRSGKAKQARTGLLRVVVNSICDGLVPDVQVVPLSLNYDRIFENDAFIAEMQGAHGQATTALRLAASFATLLSQIMRGRLCMGAVDIGVGTCVSLGAFIDDHWRRKASTFCAVLRDFADDATAAKPVRSYNNSPSHFLNFPLPDVAAPTVRSSDDSGDVSSLAMSSPACATTPPQLARSSSLLFRPLSAEVLEPSASLRFADTALVGLNVISPPNEPAHGRSQTGESSSGSGFEAHAGAVGAALGSPAAGVAPGACASGMAKALLPDQAARARLASMLGYFVLDECNFVSVILPSSLVATVMLTQPKRGLQHGELVQKALWLRREIMMRGSRVASRPGRKPVRLIADVVDRVLASVGGGSADDANIVKMYKTTLLFGLYGPKERLTLAFYRNQLIHVFVTEALIACAMYGIERRMKAFPAHVPVSELARETHFLAQLLRIEFIYRPQVAGQDVFQDTLSAMVARGIFARDDAGRLFIDESRDDPCDDESASRGTEMYLFLCSLLWPFLDAYLICVLALFRLVILPDNSISVAAFLAHAQTIGESLYFDEVFDLYESVSKETLQNALRLFAEWGVLTITSSPGASDVLRADDDSLHAHDDVIKLQAEFVWPFSTDTPSPDPAAPLDRLCSQISLFKKRARVYASRRFASLAGARSDLVDALVFAKAHALGASAGAGAAASSAMESERHRPLST